MAKYYLQGAVEYKICPICGAEFKTKNPKRIYCTPDCGREANARKRAKERKGTTYWILGQIEELGYETHWRGPGYFCQVQKPDGDVTLWFAENDDGTWRCELEDSEGETLEIDKKKVKEFCGSLYEDPTMLDYLTDSQLLTAVQRLL